MSTSNILRGRAIWLFTESNYDVDRTIGVANIASSSMEDLARLCMQEVDPDFHNHVLPGDLLVGGDNFGYGHPHYQAMIAMRAVGIAGVIAESFSPDFLKGEAAAGFPLIACPGILDAVDRFDLLEVDWPNSVVKNITKNIVLNGKKLPVHFIEMIAAGGLLPHLRKRYQAESVKRT